MFSSLPLCPPWQYSPFRAGYEWWLPLDMVRILILTSWMGFVSKACYIKVLMSQMIALVFLVLFLHWRPCTSFVCASNDRFVPVSEP